MAVWTVGELYGVLRARGRSQRELTGLRIIDDDSVSMAPVKTGISVLSILG